jgi:PAS domain S-box-containing protein
VIMLQKPSEQVQACLERAFEAERKACGSADPALKADFLEMEKRWVALARSYEFAERLTEFTAENANWRRKFDERLQAGERPDHERRLRKIIQEGDVNALFERMWLASIVEFSDDAIISRNVDGIILSWNKGAERLFGYLAEEAVGKPLTITVPPGCEDEYCAILEGARRGDHVQHHEIVRQRKDGSLIDISLTVSPIGGPGGKVVGISNIARDITERKAHEEHVRLLTSEVNHRAKNILSVVSAIARQTATKNPEDFVERFSERIQALSASQDLLIRNEWKGVDIEDLVRAQLALFANLIDARIAVRGPTLRLKAASAQAIGLALHELATNAGKYGALSTDKGRVEIWWEAAANMFTMSWAENEGPPVVTPTRRGFGSTVISKMAKHSLDGEVALYYARSGLMWQLTCPAANALELQEREGNRDRHRSG